MSRLWAFIKRRKKTSIAIAIAVVLIGYVAMTAGAPAQPEYLTETAKKGDIRQTVEAVGTVISERELELRFGGVGIVSDVYVREGQRVAGGQRLAQLRAGSLGASIASQQAAVQQAIADLRALQEGSRPEDIAIAEADVASKKASLQAAQSTVENAERNLSTAQDQLTVLQQEAKIGLAGQVSTSLSSGTEQMVAIENALTVIDDILNYVDVQDAIVRDRPGADNSIRVQQRSALDASASARRAMNAATEYQAALSALDEGQRAVTGARTAMDALFSLLSALPETSNFSNADREAYKGTVTTQRTRIQTAGSAITSVQSSLRNASAGYDTRISSQESTITNLIGTRDKAKIDILTYQAAIQSAEAQLALKRAGARKTDIDAAAARVRAAQANLARASADYGDTVLTAPVAGIVTNIHIKAGESLPTGPAMNILGNSPFRVEMFVSEIDVPKLLTTQTGSIELDAFRGVRMKLRVNEIGVAPTLKDGVSKYGVKLDFQYDHPELKIGMTGDAEIVTGLRLNVLTVPRRAVLDSTGSGMYVRVLKADSTLEERPVTIGMEGESGDVEVLSGLTGGETIVVLVKK